MTVFLEFTRSLSFATGFLVGGFALGLPLMMAGWFFGQSKVLRDMVAAYREHRDADLLDGASFVPLELIERKRR